MDESAKNSPCKECKDGADGVLLHAEVDHLRQHLAERDAHIVALETEFVKCTARTNDLEEQLDNWREKYERLHDSYKRVQKLNQVLEEKLLQMVDKMKSEKSQLTKDIATLSVRLAESKHNYSMLQKENERYKNDMNLAIQLLQCKPDNFVSQKLDNLPVDTQARVSQYVMSKTSKPPSSSQSKNGNENIDAFDTSEYEFNISASLMSKILEDSIQDTVTKHCDTCTCSKSQNKPFSYNESYYSIATQTIVSGEIKNSYCSNCNPEIKSLNSNLSITSMSPPGNKIIHDKAIHEVAPPLYILPQTPDCHKAQQETCVEKTNINYNINGKIKIDENIKLEVKHAPDEVNPKIEDAKQLRKNSMSMEPAVHHKLCDHTRTPISSKKGSIHSVGNEDLLKNNIPKTEIIKAKNESIQSIDNLSLRKNSQSSMGAVSRTSSIAKSTVSTHKSNTQVGPGPRFCHLRMQAGSKNILLDNAQPDVPPILYKRQSKCNENPIFKDLNDGMENFMELDKSDDDTKINARNDSTVIESTLIDVHVDNTNKEQNTSIKNTSINPNVLLNVSSSPLQPLKTHNYLNNLENNNKTQNYESSQNASEIDNLLTDFTQNTNNSENNNREDKINIVKQNVFTPTDNHDVKIFNFDRYEQSKLTSHYAKPLRKIEMSHLHSLENTKISKDFPPQVNLSKIVEKKTEASKSSMPAIVNVYPNLTQTHLKVNESKKVFTNEQSTSSLSSDDSAALLQKQQLLRVAEWVEQNLEQQNNLNDPLEDDVGFNRSVRRDSKLSRLTESLNELALNMPHPVSKYSKAFTRDNHNNWVHKNFIAQDVIQERSMKQTNNKVTNNVVKETIFPVEYGDVAITEVNADNVKNFIRHPTKDVGNELRNTFDPSGDKDISPEELARMEYNVKKFLLSGPYWENTETVGRSRRTSSKTETDV